MILMILIVKISVLTLMIWMMKMYYLIFSQPPPPIGGVSNDTMRSLAPVGGVGLGSSGNITGYRSLSNASSTSSHGSHHGLPVMNIFRHNPDSTKPSTPSPILSTASSSSTLSNKKVVKN